MAAQTTSVTIDGAKTELVFGARYRVRYGRDSKILTDAELAERAANGDLVFRVLPDADGANGGTRRVRPSTIDAIFGSGTEVLDYADQRIDGVEPRTTVRTGSTAILVYPEGDVDSVEVLALTPAVATVRLPNGETYRTVPEDLGIGVDDLIDPVYDPEPETFGPVDSPLRDELARQAEVDALVERFASDGDRDPDSVSASVETELARRAESIVSPRRDDETAVEYLARLEQRVPKGLGAAYVRWLETDPGQHALEDARREIDQARTGKAKRGPTQIVVDGTVVAETRTIDAPVRTGKAYADRNQVWKCGTCKRRTRRPECANGHAPVSAPVGKRLADRIAEVSESEARILDGNR